MKNVDVVLHTHWDREWYFTTSDSLVLLDHVISDVLRVLAEHQNLNFCLDGQISIVDDYLKIRPEKLEIIKKFVESNRLIIGPWYTQTDTYYVSGESIVNNLYYGIYQAKNLLGKYMKIAYLPDTFGFSNQVPMIAAGFGIKNAIIWRGIDFEKDQIEPYFVWKSMADDRINTAILHGGYGAFKNVNAKAGFFEKKVRPFIDELSEMTKQQQILMPVGNDQANIIVDIETSLKSYGKNFQLSTYEQFFEKFDATVAPDFQGEFRQTRFARVHRSSGGVRVDIKQSNYQAEQQLIRVTQPLVAMAFELGIDISPNIIWEAWKKLFESQAHDGIIGCIGDSVADDILNRNKQAYELAKAQENLIKKLIAQQVQLQENEILLFNLDLHDKDEFQVVEVFSNQKNISFEDVEAFSIIESKITFGNQQALVEKPEKNYYEREEDYYQHKVLIKQKMKAFSYQVISFNSNDNDCNKEVEIFEIKNKDYHFFIENNELILKTQTTQYDNFIQIIDAGNLGDTYDFSPMPDEIKAITFQIDQYNCKRSEHYQKMQLTYKAMLPQTLEDRWKQIATVAAEVVVTIKLIGNQEPEIDIEFENNIYNHNLRIGFKTNVESSQSVASSPFGYIKREILKDKLNMDWKLTELEAPIDIYPNSGVVGLANEECRLWILNKGVKEYQVVGTYIFFTLLSSTDELGKEDLPYRPGRASGDISKKGHVRIFTPLAQVLGRHEYSFKVGEFNNIETAIMALEEFEYIPTFYQNQSINLFYERIDNKIDILETDIALPRGYQGLKNFDEYLVTTVYNSKYDNELIIRGYSLVDLEISRDWNKLYQVCDLLEQPINIKKLKAFKLYTFRRKK